jgi:glycosyltransferase involved in cell wall biosynthesis
LDRYGASSGTNKPRVLLMCNTISPGGGPAGYTYNLLDGAKKLDPIVTFVTLAGINGGNSAGQKEIHNWIKRAVISALRPFTFLLPSGLRVGRTTRLDISLADIVVVQGFQNVNRMLYAKDQSKPTVYMPHSPRPMCDEYAMARKSEGLRPSRARYLRDLLDERRMLKFADYLVFPTKNSEAAYRSKFPKILERARIKHIESGVPQSRVHGYEVPIKAIDESPIVMFLGRYVSDKGFDLFLSAATTLKARGIEATFQAVGKGPIRCSGENVEDIGWKTNPFSYLARADVIVVPNRFALFDLLPIEAALLGKGLVMTSVGGSIDQISAFPDSIGCTIEGLPDAIDEALLKVRANNSWGIANRNVAIERFGSNRMAQEWSKFCVAILSGERLQ